MAQQVDRALLAGWGDTLPNPNARPAHDVAFAAPLERQLGRGELPRLFAAPWAREWIVMETGLDWTSGTSGGTTPKIKRRASSGRERKA